MNELGSSAGDFLGYPFARLPVSRLGPRPHMLAGAAIEVSVVSYPEVASQLTEVQPIPGDVSPHVARQRDRH
jgi:hypothetical protein